MEYRHTQIGTMIIVGIITAIGIYLTYNGVTGAVQPISLGVLVVLIVVLGLFHSLTVEIKNDFLVCRFGPGFIQKKIQLSEIREVKNVVNPWYTGWGIRWRPGGYWLWNVSGYKAIELVFNNGKRFRIGTDEPESLIKAIQSNKSSIIA